MILFPYILWLLFSEAYSNVKKDQGNNKASKLMKFFWIGSWFLLPKLAEASNWLYLLIPGCYVILRVGIFDIFYNALYGHEWDYRSDSTWVWDDLINKVKIKKPLYIILIAICLISSFYVLNWMI